MTTLYLVRHAHADWNSDEGRPLSARGRASAIVLGELLEPMPIEAVYSSPARRAIETVEPLSHRLQLELVIVPDLRERELHVAPGADFEATVRDAWHAPETARAGSESNDTARARGLRALRGIVAAHSGRHAAVATHGSLLALMMNGLDPAIGFEFWRGLTFPDVYELRFQDGDLAGARRIWG